MNENNPVNEEEKLPATETQIFQIKRVVFKNNTLCLIQYIAIILIAILFFLPLINIDLVIAEKNISLFDTIIASSKSETLKGQLAYILGSTAFNVPEKMDYNFFLAIIIAPVECWDSQNIVKSIFTILWNVFFLFGFFIFLYYFIIRALFMIIPICLRYDVERYLRYATSETFDKLFFFRDKKLVETPTFIYDYETNLEKNYRERFKNRKKFKKDSRHLVGNCIGLSFINVFAACFPLSMIFKVMAVEGVTVHFLLPFLIIALTLCIIVCNILQIIHSRKYMLTIHQTQALKRLIKI